MPLINQHIPRLKKLAFSINIPMPSVPQFKSYAQQNFPKYLDSKLYHTSYHDIDESEDNHLTHITKNANEDRYFAIQGNFAYDYIEKNQFYLIEFYQFNKKKTNGKDTIMIIWPLNNRGSVDLTKRATHKIFPGTTAESIYNRYINKNDYIDGYHIHVVPGSYDNFLSFKNDLDNGLIKRDIL